MDPNKAASAPEAGWNPGEKNAQGMSAPPPYQDHPQYANAGYPPQPGPGYPAQYPGYSAAPQGYSAAPQGYGPPPQNAYGQQPYPMSPGQQYPAQPGSVVVQPTVFVHRAPLTQPVNDYLGYSIFTMLCCCLPLGVAALIYSISTRDANMAGDQITAERKSNTARTLNHVALGIGLTFLVLYIIGVIVVLAIR
ncbi:synapse differentiation-inducing gene protein 1-like isoform X2 [Gadus chalcogrammus]|uniref:synapse differentiation-inducing gene protein 1-like isoform X2 n=1 Tax=Gadus chalcogrammus TaxID=1042646 RepID=UPI0024C4DE77|nr:synapse differentiation-inducing gene protein 1-like isoform X2 [Gadus chalcogrammus]